MKNSEQPLPNFYVGMEIVSAENSAFNSKGAIYEILEINDNELLISTNYSQVTHHVLKSEFFKRFGLKPNKNQPMNQTIDPNELKPETEIERLSKAFNNHAETQEKRLQLMVNLYDKLQGKFESLQKEFDERCPKKIKTKAEPEPQPNKLPVTIEDVWAEESKMNGRESFFLADAEIKNENFSSSKYVDEFRHESTAKKGLAFLTLLKIAEAQNEMCERKEIAYCAYENSGKINITKLFFATYGQIYFHSEQGLKDCIAANEQLFKDYLEISN